MPTSSSSHRDLVIIKRLVPIPLQKPQREMSFKEKAFENKGHIFPLKGSVASEESSFPCLHVPQTRKTPDLAWVRKKRATERKGENCQTSWLEIRNKSFPSLALSGPVSGAADEAEEEHCHSDLAPHNVTQQKWVRKQDPGRDQGNINSAWVRPAFAYRSFARPRTAGGHFDLLNFHTFLRDLGDDKGELKQHCSLGFSKALASDLQLEPLIRDLALTPVAKQPCSAMWK